MIERVKNYLWKSEIRQVSEEIKSERKEKLRIGVLLLQDKQHVHTAQVALVEAANSGLELLPHSPYLPELAPSDFFLFLV